MLAGGSGALGRRIADDLAARGDDVVVLTRSPRPQAQHRQVAWDGATVGPWSDELPGSVLVNLAGELVDRRPTAANIELLTRSRVGPTSALVAAAGATGPPTTWVQMSTVAIYGDGGDRLLDERAAVADGPAQMAGVARAWEKAATGAPAGRQVILRTAVVLDPGTAAMDRLVWLVRHGLGGRVGSGSQWFSWLHVGDLLAVVRRSIDDQRLIGVVHATSPNPVRNAELMAELRRVLGRPPAPPTPAWLVRLGSIALRTDPQLALLGRRCVPARLDEAGFTFAYPRLRPALEDLLAPS